jgi:hypothetical protein
LLQVYMVDGHERKIVHVAAPSASALPGGGSYM